MSVEVWEIELETRSGPLGELSYKGHYRGDPATALKAALYYLYERFDVPTESVIGVRMSAFAEVHG